MKFTLTPSQAITLTRAPNDWEKLPDNTCTTALRLAGLIDIRDAPGERTLARGFQWRITLTGARLQQRKVKPAHEVVTASKEITPQPNGTKRKYTKRGGDEIILACGLRITRPQAPVDGESVT